MLDKSLIRYFSKSKEIGKNKLLSLLKAKIQTILQYLFFQHSIKDMIGTVLFLVVIGHG